MVRLLMKSEPFLNGTDDTLPACAEASAGGQKGRGLGKKACLPAGKEIWDVPYAHRFIGAKYYGAATEKIRSPGVCILRNQGFQPSFFQA